MNVSVCVFPSLSRVPGSAKQEERQRWGFISRLNEAERDLLHHLLLNFEILCQIALGQETYGHLHY